MGELPQYGLALAGLVLVTVNPARRAAELAYVLRQSRARGVLHQTEYRGHDMRAAIAEALAAEDLDIPIIVCLDEFATFAASGDVQTELPAISPTDPCMIQYTSGTTGNPKGPREPLRQWVLSMPFALPLRPP